MADQNNPYEYNTQHTGGASIGDATQAYGNAQGQGQGQAPRLQGWYCSNCGTYQTQGVFCGNCGTPRSGVTTGQLMGGAASVPAAQPQPQPQQPQQPQEQYKPWETPRLDPTDPGFDRPSIPVAPAATPAVSSGKAIAALILGIFAFMSILFIVPALIFAIVGLVLAISFQKAGGQHGAASVGKFICIASLVLTVLWGALIGYVIATEPDILEEAIEISEVIIEEGKTGNGAGQGSGGATGSNSSAEAAAKSVAYEVLQPFVVASDATVKKLADDLEESQMESLGFSFEEMGIDVLKLAKWELEDFTFTIDRVSISSDGQSATVRATLEMRDLTSFYGIIATKCEALDESSFSSVSELYRAVGDIWDEASGMVTTEGDVAVIPLVKKNGGWSLDQENWDIEYRRIFAI